MSETCTLIEPPCSLERPWSRRHAHAPRGDESFVADPPLAEARAIAHRNGAGLAGAKVDIQGRELGFLRHWARREVLRAAREYTTALLSAQFASAGIDDESTGRGARESTPAAPQQPGCSSDAPDPAATMFYIGGHQPTLFHPGVWVKNFVVGRLAQNDRAVGLNLIVDTDTLSGTAVRVPGGSREAPAVAVVPFDAPRPRQPWEEARILDRELFGSFAARVGATLGDWGFTPLIAEFWPAALRRSATSDSLAECLTAARSAWERRWGCANLELPVSRLCTLEPFLWFAAHLLAHLPRFRKVYNEVLHEYRDVNRVRSRTHPVPDLRENDGWIEAPFRVWRAGDEVRRRVFARQDGGEVRLSDGENVFATLPLTPGKDACCAVRELQKLAGRGIRFRTRALTTTIFARLCLADLFVHGIGGAKYDQMTDRIAARFFGICAPQFLTLSATLQLPVPGFPVEAADERRLARQLRELDYNSDRHLPPGFSAAARELVALKQRLVAEQNAARRGGPRAAPDPARNGGAGYERFRALQEVNRRLAELTREERRRIEEELSRTRQQLAANAVLRDRDLAFCLYPAEKLQRFLDHVARSAGG
jgi:hypothetical protein